jgi:hypothetical protein
MDKERLKIYTFSCIRRIVYSCFFEDLSEINFYNVSIADSYFEGL